MSGRICITVPQSIEIPVQIHTVCIGFPAFQISAVSKRSPIQLCNLAQILPDGIRLYAIESQLTDGDPIRIHHTDHMNRRISK